MAAKPRPVAPPFEPPSSWTVEVALPAADPILVPLAPIPSGLPACLIALRAPRSEALLRHLHTTLADLGGTAALRGLQIREVQSGVGCGSSTWLLVGAVVRGGAVYTRLLEAMTGRGFRRALRLQTRGRLLLLDPRSGEELQLTM